MAVANIGRGERAAGLLSYLLGPGDTENDHVNPRVIAGWRDPAQLQDMTARVDGEEWPNHRILGYKLDQTWTKAGLRPEHQPVYHVSVGLARANPDLGLLADPHLGDAQFKEICDGLMERVGLADQVRWVAVRHDEPGKSHAHIVATLASEDGRRVQRPWNDRYRMGDVCREFEERFGLRRTAARERSAQPAPTLKESEKASRLGWQQPTRVVVREKVREVVAELGERGSLSAFFAGLEAKGLLVHQRVGRGDRVTGYSVAMTRPARGTKTVERVWFSGSKLSSDLSLRAVATRWGEDAGRQPSWTPDRAVTWSEATRVVREAASAISSFGSDPQAAAAAAWAASDFLASAARVIPGRQGVALKQMAAAFDRSGRLLLGPEPGRSELGDGLRQASRLFVLAGFVPDEDAKRVLLLMAQVAVLGDALAGLRETQEREFEALQLRHAVEQVRQASPIAVSYDYEMARRPDQHRVREFARLRELSV